MSEVPIHIDLYSDTQTRPSREMRKAIFESEVGDEQMREDPTVNLLHDRVCQILGKESALFLPSGTMCNQIAIRVYCQPGDEIILDRTAHVWNAEAGGSAALSGALVHPINGERGIYEPDQLIEAVRPADRHYPGSRLAVVEQANSCGAIWPLETIQAVAETAHSHGLVCHMDGARLFNACVKQEISPARYCDPFDSIWIDFSKGLGAPVGAALAGSYEFIEQAWRWKQQFGGAMRQAGIIAAAALYALENNIDRLTEDHDNARRLSEGLSSISGIQTVPVETNLVFFNVHHLGCTELSFAKTCREHGLRVSTPGGTRLRAVTHLDVSESDIDEAIRIFAKVAAFYSC